MVVISRLVAPENLVGLVNCDFIFSYAHNAKMRGFVHAARMIHEKFLFTRAGIFFLQLPGWRAYIILTKTSLNAITSGV